MLPSWIGDCTIATFPKTGKKIEYRVTAYRCSCGLKPQTKVYPKRGSTPYVIAKEMQRKIDAVHGAHNEAKPAELPPATRDPVE